MKLNKLFNHRIIAYFNTVYAHFIPTTFSNGDKYFIFMGVLQGDSWAVSFFALGFQPSSYPSTLDYQVRIYAYVDDIYLFRSYDHLFTAVSSPPSINQSKCSLYPLPSSPIPDPVVPFVDSLIILGTPFGHSDFITTYVS